MEGISPEKVIPEAHPQGRPLRKTTDSAFDAIGFKDEEVIEYVWRLLLRFAHIDNLFRRSRKTNNRLAQAMDLLIEAEGMDGSVLWETKQQIGDVCLFFCPLSGNLSRRELNPRFYVAQGKAAYAYVAEIDALRSTTIFFRKLHHEFESCVMALHLERDFLQDLASQYIGRQFEIFVRSVHPKHKGVSCAFE
jgi:hypothetical protein